MSLLTNSLLGKKRVTEFTGTAGVPSSDGAATLNLKPKPQLRSKDPKDKKKIVKEGDNDIIPDNAEEVASTAATVIDTGVSTGLEPKGSERDGGPQSNPNLLPSSLALVAPDCTPGWDKPLSPMALPKSDRKPTVAAPAAPAKEEPKAERSALDMMKLTRPGKEAGAATSGESPNLEHMARSVAASVVQEDNNNPISIPSGEALLNQGKPMPDHVQSNASAGTLKRFNFGG